MTDLWTISETDFAPERLHHLETVFTLGNGYLATRGAFEEGYLGDRRATLIHGVFDAAPIVVTELANAPDWLPLAVYLDGARFSLSSGTLLDYRRDLDVQRGLLTRRVHWRAPNGRAATLTFERFVSLADPHRLCLRCRIVPEFAGPLTVRAALNGHVDNEGLMHWQWLAQGERDGALYLHTRTRQSNIACGYAMRLHMAGSAEHARHVWDVENAPTLVVQLEAVPGQEITVVKFVSVYTARDVPEAEVVEAALADLPAASGAGQAWAPALAAHASAWAAEWARCDVVIDGDDEAQRAARLSLFHLLGAAPRHDERVSIGAKALSGFAYRGHVFWDTETFMLPFFVYTAPHIARNLLDYRYHTLPGARRKAQAHGFAGAQFAWESADTGNEVTPTWVPHFADRTQMVRIWTGDIELHISADVAYAAYQYWRVTGDDAWFAARGAEMILDTARFWAARAEWNAARGLYEYRDVIGPDEYHDHVDNNAFTNRMAQWNLQTALDVLAWLEAYDPERASALRAALDLAPERLAHWRKVNARMYIPTTPAGLIEQFDGYFQRREVDLPSLEPRRMSVQALLGIEGANETQVLKQPDVLMLLYLLRDHYSAEVVRLNYDYYTPRTDHTYGSSLGPGIQAIMACQVGKSDEAYEHFMRVARADLRDVRGNAGEGIHAASAGGTWQALVFGFGGLRVTPEGWSVQPHLPAHWRRLAFKFVWRGEVVTVDLAGP